MMCAWQSFINLLPVWMRKDVDMHGKNDLEELRLRLGIPPELVMSTGSRWLNRNTASDDLIYCINVGSRYSPWSAATISNGYITAPGGHRIGICGEATVVNHAMTGIRLPTSLCMRVARDFKGIAKPISQINGSILIIGMPGSGKTTLLRDLIRCKSDAVSGSICVVDEKGELFPIVQGESVFPCGKRTDVLTGAPKGQGIDVALRNMSPKIIAVDEITADGDCKALIHAGWCGVHLYATAHASDLKDLYCRPVYKAIVESKLFESVVILKQDKTWHVERMR